MRPRPIEPAPTIVITEGVRVMHRAPMHEVGPASALVFVFGGTGDGRYTFRDWD
jgi:hypothetical protein